MVLIQNYVGYVELGRKQTSKLRDRWPMAMLRHLLVWHALKRCFGREFKELCLSSPRNNSKG